MKKRSMKLILIIAIILLAIITIYFSFFYMKRCSDRNCFNSALSDCKKVSYLSEVEDAVWLYKIKGEEKEQCKVYVKLVELKKGTTDMLRLEVRDMICYVSIGTTRNPQDNLGRCSGHLKEGMQDIIITRLHNYIVDNLGELSEELGKAL